MHLDRRIREAMTAYVRANLKNAPVELVIRKVRNRRSSKQNRYYFGVVLAEIAQAAGCRKSDIYQLHDAFAFKYLSLSPCPITGSPRRMRTPQTDTAEFSVYLDQIIQFAAETWGLVIPEAEKVDPPANCESRSPRAVDREHAWGVVSHAEPIAA